LTNADINVYADEEGRWDGRTPRLHICATGPLDVDRSPWRRRDEKDSGSDADRHRAVLPCGDRPGGMRHGPRHRSGHPVARTQHREKSAIAGPTRRRRARGWPGPVHGSPPAGRRRSGQRSCSLCRPPIALSRRLALALEGWLPCHDARFRSWGAVVPMSSPLVASRARGNASCGAATGGELETALGAPQRRGK
jgi:hypothetical protein